MAEDLNSLLGARTVSKFTHLVTNQVCQVGCIEIQVLEGMAFDCRRGDAAADEWPSAVKVFMAVSRSEIPWEGGIERVVGGGKSG